MVLERAAAGPPSARLPTATDLWSHAPRQRWWQRRVQVAPGAAILILRDAVSLPFELRRAAASRADVATALGRIFVEAVASEQKRAAGLVQSQPAAMNHIQRFGGALNLNLHSTPLWWMASFWATMAS
jgi:hypothetical protein